METILTLVARCEEREVEPGQDIVTEGEDRGELYILAEGAVEIFKEGMAVGEVSERGVLFGEIAALLEMPYMATVRARTRARLKRVREARPFLCSHPEILREVAEVLAWRLVSTSNHLADNLQELLKQSAEGKALAGRSALELDRYREFWKDSWKLFERQRYHDVGLPCEFLKYEQFMPEEEILRQSGMDGRAYILRTGTVEILKNEVPLFMVWDKGVLFGEVAALLGTGHTATVRALEPCTLQVVENIKELFDAHPGVAWFLCASLARRLLDVNKYFAGLKRSFQSMRARFNLERGSILERCVSSCEKGLYRIATSAQR